MPPSQNLSTAFKGSLPGLTLQLTRVRTVAPSQSAITIAPSYLGRSTQLPGARLLARGFKLSLGGLLNQQVLPEAALLSGSGSRLILFDAGPIDGIVDSFYLNDFSFPVPSLSVLGVRVSDLKLQLKEISNHPDFNRLTNTQAPRWLGSIELSGRQLAVPALPQLVLGAGDNGVDAFNGTYSLANGDLSINIGSLTYSSPALNLGLTKAALKMSNSAKTVTFQGQGSFTLPQLGLAQVAGSVDLQMAHSKLTRLQADFSVSKPIGGLGLSGALSLEHHFDTGVGSIDLDAGQVFGVGATGTLRYGANGVSGSLSLNNQAKAALPLGISGFSLTPLSGTIAYSSATDPKSQSGGSVSLKDARFSLDFGATKATFTGNITFDLSSKSLPVLRTADLALDSDASINLDGFKINLLASNQDAPTKLSLETVNGQLRPSLSGQIQFSDLGGLKLTVPRGGIGYGSNGWDIQDVSLGLDQDLDLGLVRIGSNASARYQAGKLTVNPDLSLDRQVFNSALKPIADGIQRYVSPVVDPVVSAFKTDIDLGTKQGLQKTFETIKTATKADMPALWRSFVSVLEDVPGNPYQDGKLTAGELLDYVGYQAFKFVRDKGDQANEAFRMVFNADIPQWLKTLPAVIDYRLLSLSATVGRMEALSSLVAQISSASAGNGDLMPLPLILELPANASNPELVGGESAKQKLKAELANLYQALTQDSTIPTGPAKQLAVLPLQFDYKFAVPLFEEPVQTFTRLIGNKPFDLMRGDFSIKSGLELSMGMPLAPVFAAIPAVQSVAPVLKAVNATVDLRAGLAAELALTLGLSSNTATLGKLVDDLKTSTPALNAIAKTLTATDALTGQSMGLFLGQTGQQPLLSLKPLIEFGLAISRFGATARGYGQLNGALNLGLNSSDPLGRVYLRDVITGGLKALPGITASAKVDGEVGLRVSAAAVGSLNPKVTFPVISETTLFQTKTPPAQALMAMSPDPLSAAGPPALLDREPATGLLGHATSTLGLA